MRILEKDEIVSNVITVINFLGEGNFSEVYYVDHKYLGKLALKVLKPGNEVLYDYDKMMNEARILSKITHQNIIRVFDANTFVKNGQILFYISSEFVAGESLMDLFKRKFTLDIDVALSFQKDICSALKFVHENSPIILHRDVKPQNVLVSYQNKVPLAKLGDFGLAIKIEDEYITSSVAGTMTYLANEGFWGFQTPSSDVFSAGIIFYQMITGRQAWYYDFDLIDNNDKEAVETMILKTRKNKPVLPRDINGLCDEKLQSIILKAIDPKMDSRFKNGSDFLNALLEYEAEKEENNKITVVLNSNESITVKEHGKGFDEIAGMDDLKKTLYQDIILPLEQKELYEKYKITVPNGILLYGPPGCGKTFICQKLAQEVNYNFVSVKPSDLASVYVHGTQEKIGKLFEDAKKNAPTILFIDELDAVMPRRDDNLGHSYSQEVNEFLTQLSNCSNFGILMIGTSNRPDKIDSAILRTGRIDKLFFVGPPDNIARVKLFQLLLKCRPLDKNLSYEDFAKLTTGYVASDIDFVVNEASRKALLSNSLITNQIMIDILNNTKPSISMASLEIYNKFKDKREFD
ncbi:MAG: AAA family ATPase [Ignavibacteriae bacterium]|nr:AAA family ATPase [Ignavibacteriota bacterium]